MSLTVKQCQILYESMIRRKIREKAERENRTAEMMEFQAALRGAKMKLPRLDATGKPVTISDQKPALSSEQEKFAEDRMKLLIERKKAEMDERQKP